MWILMTFEAFLFISTWIKYFKQAYLFISKRKRSSEWEIEEAGFKVNMDNQWEFDKFHEDSYGNLFSPILKNLK